MRIRLLLSTVCVCLLFVVIGTPTTRAQQSLAERNQLWESVIRVGPVVTLCHIPPGNPGNAHTIEVGQAAVPAHLAHGDTLGECAGECPPYPASVQKTGQTTSRAPGDDGDYQKGVSVDPRFTDNLDGTVTDNLTGLIWLKDADCFDVQNWSGAIWWAESLASGSCGLTDGSLSGDWRIPNVRELISLIDYSQNGSALPVGHPFSGVHSSYYWSSTTFANAPSVAWYVNLSVGRVRINPKSYNYYIWPVRGPE